MNLSKKTIRAFDWIVGLLEQEGIDFFVSGGMAANVWGSPRELADIDLIIDASDFSKILVLVKDFVIFGPDRYVDENWDLPLITLDYYGQEIDLAGIEALVFNSKSSLWEAAFDRFEVEAKVVGGREVKVQTVRSLTKLKTRLGRDVDVEDVRWLERV